MVSEGIIEFHPNILTDMHLALTPATVLLANRESLLSWPHTIRLIQLPSS